MGERIKRKQVAELWGVSRQAIDELVKDGRLIEGADHCIDSDHAAEVRKGMDPEYIARFALSTAATKADPKTLELNQLSALAKTRLAATKAEDAELELKLKKGALVPKDLVTQQSYTVARMFIQRLQPLPETLAAELVVMTDRAEVRDRLQKAIDQLLEDLRTGMASLGNAGE